MLYEVITNRYKEGAVGDVEVKQKLIAAHQAYFSTARAKRLELEQNIDQVNQILATGAAKATEVAKETIKEVYQAVGLRK